MNAQIPKEPSFNNLDLPGLSFPDSLVVSGSELFWKVFRALVFEVFAGTCIRLPLFFQPGIGILEEISVPLLGLGHLINCSGSSEIPEKSSSCDLS
jgi:hypothetical protein